MKTIPDAELIADAERVTIWIASPDAPKDFWSLRDAIAWTIQKGAKITLYRPPMRQAPAAWILPEQVARLAEMLRVTSVAA